MQSNGQLLPAAHHNALPPPCTDAHCCAQLHAAPDLAGEAHGSPAVMLHSRQERTPQGLPMDRSMTLLPGWHAVLLRRLSRFWCIQPSTKASHWSSTTQVRWQAGACRRQCRWKVMCSRLAQPQHAQRHISCSLRARQTSWAPLLTARSAGLQNTSTASTSQAASHPMQTCCALTT